MEEVQREKRKRNLILAGAAFFSGALCYGGIGAVTADKARIIEIDNQFLYILFAAVLGGYIIFSLMCGILVTAGWLPGRTLRQKVFFAVLWIIPVYSVLLALFYSIPYIICQIVWLKKKE